MIQLNKMPPPPPNPGNHPACNTPNPPWWCDEAPQASIDSGIWILFVLALIIGIIFISIKEKE